LAPTSSTTATLVMGDALAVALLKARGFTAEDFALSHPGGALGGLVYALENYHQGQTTVTAAQLQPVAEAISAIHGLYADIEQDE
ncbi:hypothetical protein MJL30_39255, partial [Salmonella enterica subsp. enterica serovar Anatum]|nr:hypothetical protein [Salmonella enterica subsp. enterica serovar Anatum]